MWRQPKSFLRRLSGMLLLDPDGTDRLLAGFKLPPGHWISTDDNLYLEYATPKGNVLDGDQSFVRNVEMIRTASARAANAPDPVTEQRHFARQRGFAEDSAP